MSFGMHPHRQSGSGSVGDKVVCSTGIVVSLKDFLGAGFSAGMQYIGSIVKGS